MIVTGQSHTYDFSSIPSTTAKN